MTMSTLAPRSAPFDPRTVRLIAITDSLRDGPRGLALRAAAAVAGGATMLQLRLKDESARSLVEIARTILAMAPEVPLIINDRADVALAAGAAGVHVGVDDLAPALLRRVAPPGFIIGASVGTDDEVARPGRRLRRNRSRVRHGEQGGRGRGDRRRAIRRTGAAVWGAGGRDRRDHE